MTYPPQHPYQTPPTQGSSGWTAPAPQKPRRTNLVAVVALVVAAVLLLAAIAVALFAAGAISNPLSPGLSKEGAERACRTAFNREWEQRNARADGGTATTIVASVQRIELLETWETDDGYSVNGTIHFTLTAGIVAPVEDTISLACTATGSDDSPVTSVSNRN